MSRLKLETDTVIIDLIDYAGDTVKLAMNHTDDQGIDTDFSGCTVEWIFKTSPKATSSVLTLSNNNGAYLNQITGYNIYAVISSDQTAALGAGNFYHDIVITSSLGEVKTYFSGILMLRSR